MNTFLFEMNISLIYHSGDAFDFLQRQLEKYQKYHQQHPELYLNSKVVIFLSLKHLGMEGGVHVHIIPFCFHFMVEVVVSKCEDEDLECTSIASNIEMLKLHGISVVVNDIRLNPNW
ncbi:hypothetical protein [Aeromonas hydrophila]|uniref:hypothetical protein n=1 Tax=Aeromonas hydrophila TaxID=644 RepID=UPI003EC5A1E4